MNKPKWQRARVVRFDVDPRLIGRELWVRIAPPTLDHRVNRWTGMPDFSPCYDVNLLGSNGEVGAASKSTIELLARDENDFADDVPLIPWEQWLKDSVTEKTT